MGGRNVAGRRPLGEIWLPGLRLFSIRPGLRPSGSYNGEIMFFTDLETERLFLKNISADDCHFIFEEYSSDFVNKYMFDAEPMSNISEAKELIQFYCEEEPRGQHRWVIIEKLINQKIGSIGYHCWNFEKKEVEIGYELLQEKNGKGYMSEAMDEVIKFGRNKMNIKKIKANVYYENERSVNILTKHKFTKMNDNEVIFREKCYKHELYELVL